MSDEPAKHLWGEGDDRGPRHVAGRYSPESDVGGPLSEESVPDCVGKLLGARCFLPRHLRIPSKHRDDRLYSLFYEHMWTPGEDEHAECLYHHTAPKFAGRATPRRHASPHEGCTCGLYAYYSYWRAWSGCAAPLLNLDKIFAVVSGWGNIEEHRSGFRSEYMRIEALVGPSPATVRRRKARKTIERFAEIYKVPVIWHPRQVHRWMDDFAGGIRLENQK